MQFRFIVFTVLATAVTLIQASPVPATGDVLPRQTTSGSTGTEGSQNSAPIDVDLDNGPTLDFTLHISGVIKFHLTPDTPLAGEAV